MCRLNAFSYPAALTLSSIACAADGSAWGALLLNSNGQEMVALADRLTFRAIGGVIDLVGF